MRTRQNPFRNMTIDLEVPYTEELFRRYHMINKKIWEQIERGEIAVGDGCCRRFEILMREYGTEGRWRTVGTRISEISE